MTSAAETPSSSMDVDRDAAAVVGDGDRAVGVERHRDRVAIAGERLVDGVVDDLVDHVVQARAVIGVADIHARALAHGIEAAQHLDRIARRRRVVRNGLAVIAENCRMSTHLKRSIGRDDGPRRTAKNCARPRKRGEQGGVGAGEPGLGAEAKSSAKERGAALAHRDAPRPRRAA